MEKIGLLLDTTTMTREDILTYDFIKWVPLGVTIDDVLYQESDLSTSQMMGYLHDGKRMLTSQPSPGEFLKKYEEFHNEGYTHILVIALSEKISGTYQSAVIAKNLCELPITISVHSPKVASFGVALAIPMLAEAIVKKTTFADLEKRYDSLFANAHVMFTLSNLMHLFRGGRLSRVAALLGTVLRIKPIVEMIDGKLQLTKKERTNIACYEQFLEVVKQYTEKYKSVFVDIVQLNREEWGNKLSAAIMEQFPKVIVHQSHYVSPVFLVHLGDAGFGIAVIGE